MKKGIKIVGVFVICILAIVFLYSRMHVDYEAYSQKEKEKLQDNVESQEKVKIPSVYEKYVDEELNFKVQVMIEEAFDENELYAATATVAKLDAQKIYDFLMKDKENVQQAEYDDQIDMEGNPSVLHVYESQSGDYLALQDTSVYYGKSPQIDYIYNSFFASADTEQYNADNFSQISDLHFKSRERAWENLREDLINAGFDLTFAQVKGCYSLDAATLQKEELCIDLDGSVIEEEQNPDWSKEDEGYYYYIGQQYAGLPIYESYKVENELESIETSPMRIFQTEEGLCEFAVDRWFLVECTEEKVELVSFEKIMKTIEEKYSGVINSNPLTVTQAKLYEYPVQTEKHTYTLIPVWICTLEETLEDVDGGTYISHIQIPINAVTGEEMSELEI